LILSECRIGAQELDRPLLSQQFPYDIEINGVVCGYARLVTSLLHRDEREVTVLKHEIVLKGSLHGAPVDSTIKEIDYVDFGHIRFGPYQSVATALKAGRFEILEHHSPREGCCRCRDGDAARRHHRLPALTPKGRFEGSR
jgi:hypothetical protein